MKALLEILAFRDAVMLFPVAVMLHVLEEWPGFPRWARRFASPGYSDRAYLVTHALAIGGALALALLLRVYSPPWLLFLFFAFWFLPGVLCNACFHVGASVLSRAYCPGAITGALLYVPLSLWLAHLALDEGLLAAPALGLAGGIAVAFHTLEVGHNVFERW